MLSISIFRYHIGSVVVENRLKCENNFEDNAKDLTSNRFPIDKQHMETILDYLMHMYYH